MKTLLFASILALLSSPAHAMPACFWIDAQGRTIDLSTMCGNEQPASIPFVSVSSPVVQPIINAPEPTQTQGALPSVTYQFEQGTETIRLTATNPQRNTPTVNAIARIQVRYLVPSAVDGQWLNRNYDAGSVAFAPFSGVIEQRSISVSQLPDNARIVGVDVQVVPR